MTLARPWYAAHMINTAQLQQAVQYNCDISDARFARDYSMCVYLLRMQEYYRWKHNIGLSDTVDGDKLGDWVRSTEDYWDTIEEREFKPVEVDGNVHDPFDCDAINQSLQGHTDLVYSAGIGRLGQPHFVLATCIERSDAPHRRIECGAELARDSITLPAMMRDGTIYIRHDGIVRMLWQMVAEWRIKRLSGPMQRLVEHYRLDDSDCCSNTHMNSAAPAPVVPASIVKAAKQFNTLIHHHELGEIRVVAELGDQYLQMIATLQGRRSEAFVRAVGDLLADSLGSWPYIADRQSTVHLDFWLAGLSGIREDLFQKTPLSQLLSTAAPCIATLTEHLPREQARWRHIAERLLEQFQRDGKKLDAEAVINQALRATLHD